MCTVRVLWQNFLSFYSPSISLNAYALRSKLPFMAVFKGYRHHYREGRGGVGKEHTCVELKRPFTRLLMKCCVQGNPQKKPTNRQRERSTLHTLKVFLISESCLPRLHQRELDSVSARDSISIHQQQCQFLRWQGPDNYSDAGARPSFEEDVVPTSSVTK